MSDEAKVGDEQTEKETLKGVKGFWSEHGGKAFLGLVASLIMFALGVWWNSYEGRLRSFKYTIVSANSIVGKPNLQATVTVAIDGRTVEDISRVQVTVYNSSDQDFEDVPIHFRFAPINGKAPILLQQNIEGVRENIGLRPTTKEADNSLSVAAVVKVANRSQQIFSQEFLFEGAIAPAVSISLLKKGVTIDELTVTNNAITAADILIVPVVMIAIIAAFFFALQRNQTNFYQRMYRKSMHENSAYRSTIFDLELSAMLDPSNVKIMERVKNLKANLLRIDEQDKAENEPSR